MSGKVKMRCARCGKPFKSSGAKQTLCAACETIARSERAASKTAAPKTTGPVQAQAQAPKIVGPGASILVPGLVSTGVSAPPESGPFGRRQFERGGSGATTETRERPGQSAHSAHGAPGGHPAHGPASSSGAHRTPQGPHGAQATHEKPQRPARHDGPQKQGLPPRTPKEPKQVKPPTPPMELSDEVRQKVEQRYLELANPVEFDGIRTQIAGELGVPKALVKRAVQELRGRMQLPSWWELQSFTGGHMDLERVRRAYVPLLPVPEVGIHKKIAEDLGLEAGDVYQAIKRIRAEMRLPRYNAPELHEDAKPAVAGAEGEERPALDGQVGAAGTGTGSGDEVAVSAQGGEAR